MIVVPYRPAHYDAFTPRAYERRFRALLGDPQAYAAALAESGVAFTLVERGRVLGCLGVLEIWPGVGEGWLSLSTAFEIGRPTRRWARAARLIALELEIAMQDFHRIQTAIPLNFPPGQRLVRRLGFEPEGLRRKYGADGGDFIAFARVR